METYVIVFCIVAVVAIAVLVLIGFRKKKSKKDSRQKRVQLRDTLKQGYF